MALSIQVGQHWKTRNGSILRVTRDRGEAQRWRWALNNSAIADEEGRISFSPGHDHQHDLMELLPPEQGVSDAAIKATDSMMGGL